MVLILLLHYLLLILHLFPASLVEWMVAPTLRERYARSIAPFQPHRADQVLPSPGRSQRAYKQELLVVKVGCNRRTCRFVYCTRTTYPPRRQAIESICMSIVIQQHTHAGTASFQCCAPLCGEGGAGQPLHTT